jgi:hypothetical protein
MGKLATANLFSKSWLGRRTEDAGGELFLSLGLGLGLMIRMARLIYSILHHDYSSLRRPPIYPLSCSNSLLPSLLILIHTASFRFGYLQAVL